MQRGLAREARRRPDLDLLVGPLEAAEPNPTADPQIDPIGPDPFEAEGIEERPPWRDDG
jgi:hypothetical protein